MHASPDAGQTGTKNERKGPTVLVPDPKVLRRLLTRYACLRIALAERETSEKARELADVSYTLCVMMGTRHVHDAVAAADRLLAADRHKDTTEQADGGNGLQMAV